MKRVISVILSLAIFFPIFTIYPQQVMAYGMPITHYQSLPFTHPHYIPSGIPAKSANGKDFNDEYWITDKYHVIVYGEPYDVKPNDFAAGEFRYLGFDKDGQPISNPHFPNDGNSNKPLSQKNWINKPWNEGLCVVNIFSEDKRLENIINRMADSLGWSPEVSGGKFFLYGLVQSLPTFLKEGSFRMWHRANDGKVWYQTFNIPKLTEKDDVKFTVTTEILSNDFTIDLNENTVDVTVKVTARLHDESIYGDLIDRVLYYNRDDIKKWDLKVEYKGKEIHKQLAPNGTNTMSETFTIKLSRNDITDGENIIFTGTGRVTFHNDHYYRDSDPKPAKFTVVPIPTPAPGVTPAPLPPDLTVSAPEKKNINESYTVTINPIIPQGESIKSVVLERSFNGGAYQPVALSGYSASEQYGSTGIVNYRATITLNNELSQTATASTRIVDERASTAKARIEQPGTAYEGHWIIVYNRNTFTFEGTTYNAKQAAELGLGNSYFEILDFSLYPLSSSLYQTRNYNNDVSFEIRYNEPGRYKNTIWAFPLNSTEVSDTRSIQVLSCPSIIASLEGTRKSNRKLTLDFSRTVFHPDYPIVNSKTYVIIEDAETGEKVTVTNSSHPDSANIKTNALSGNKMDFLIKTEVNKEFKITIYVEDTRGNNDTYTMQFIVAPDKAPIVKITAKEEEIRKPGLGKKAEIFVHDDSYSEDGDYITRTWEVAIDTNNNGSFADETYKPITQMDGYQDLSGDGSLKKVSFLKSGVGKVDVRLTVKEVFGQPTIDEFVTAADRKSAASNKIIDVVNVAPSVDFKLFSNVATTINIVVGKLSEALQNSVLNYIAAMQTQLLESKISPTINFLPQSLDKSRIPWSQAQGNKHRNGVSFFDGPMNFNVKWRVELPGVVPHNDEPIKSSKMLVDYEGNIILSVTDRFFDESLNKNRSFRRLYKISPDGAILQQKHTETTSKSVQHPLAIMENGNILAQDLSSSNTVDYVIYDSNFNILKRTDVSNIVGSFLCTHEGIIYTYEQKKIADYQWEHYIRKYDYNFNLIKIIKVTSSKRTTTTYSSYSSPVFDSDGNIYMAYGYELLKLDSEGNKIWEYNVNYSVEDLAYDPFTHSVYLIYEDTWPTDHRHYIYQINADSGTRTWYNYFEESVYGTFVGIGVGKDYIYIKTSDNRDYIRIFNKPYISYNSYLNTVYFPSDPVISYDNALLVLNSTLAGCTFLKLPTGETRRIGNGNDGPDDCFTTSSGAFGNNHTAYVVGALYYQPGPGQYSQERVMGPLFIQAIGTGGYPQNLENTVDKIARNVPSSSNKDFIIAITDEKYMDGTDASMDAAANLIKSRNDHFFMIGNSSSKPDGQKILNRGVSGGLYDITSNMSSPLSAIVNQIKALIAPVDKKVYEYHYEKGEIVNYEIFYTDYELDPSKKGEWRYIHTPKTDGVIENNGVWLSSPITQFTKNGTYRVQHRQMDSTGVEAYDKWSNIIELTIHVDDGTPPPPPPAPVYTPSGTIELEGATKQNRKLTLKLIYSANNPLPLNPGSISWTLTPVSGMTASDIKRSSLSTQNIDTLYKQAGRVRATCTFKDTNNNVGVVTREFDIAPDLPPTGALQVFSPAYRNASGIASINVQANIESPDDYIASVKYYITYDANNNGSFSDDTRVYLSQFDNLRTFSYEVDTGVGNYLIEADVTEGFSEPTISEYVTAADYLKLALQGIGTVDNIAPTYDVRPEKDVYLTGEEIRFKAYDGSLLNGDASKGFFDSEKDPMTGFGVKYIQNKDIMPVPDAISAYHNQSYTDFLASLDRAGEYTIEINAYDDPKYGDTRFSSFSRPSNTCSNTIIVHRRPVAALNFSASHMTAPVYDFGSGMYLDGTQLRITDASFDPDGFSVASTICYKVDSGEYVQIESGDSISLYHGSIFTFKVTSRDNWGAEDTALYTVTVVNGLDMHPEIIPKTVPASEDITLRLTTNQYATGARAVVFGQSMDLPLKSQTETHKVWETTCNINKYRPDAEYIAGFYAISEGNVEIFADEDFRVKTPVDLIPDMPDTVVVKSEVTIHAFTSKYAEEVTVQLFTGTPYQTEVKSMTGEAGGNNKSWSTSFFIPEEIPPERNYTARFVASTPNGNVEIREVDFRVENLKITGVTISGYWNHWRGQMDIFGEQMPVQPHRFLSLEKVRIDVNTSGYADKIVISFSPELQAMQFTDENGITYDYCEDFGLDYVELPKTFLLDGSSLESHIRWEFTLPLAPSTIGWDDIRRRPPYFMKVTAWKGEYKDEYIIDDIDITGNIFDLTYIQPAN